MQTSAPMAAVLVLCVSGEVARGNQTAFEYLRQMGPRVRAMVPPQGKLAGGSPKNLVNGSGIDADGRADDSYSGWHSDGTDPAKQWVKLDLGDVRSVQALRVWNYNFTWKRPDGGRQSFAHRGVKRATLYYSTRRVDPGDGFEAKGWTRLKSVTFTQAKAYESNGPDVIPLGGVQARWLAIDIRSSYAEDMPGLDRRFVGLNEIRVVSPSLASRPAVSSPAEPAVENAEATDLATTGARLGGVLSAGNSARITAQWWPEGERGKVKSVTDEIIRNGPFQINASSLEPHTTYEYRFRAVNDAGNATSDVRSFTTPKAMATKEITGDVTICADTKYVNTHLKVLGNVRVTGGTLTLNGCVVEFMSRYAREFGIEWHGGTVVTNYTTIGGTSRDGINCQGRFDLRDGVWIATDTTVRYTYGIVFGSTRPLLYATRLSRGPNPDSIILGRSDARVVLKDSVYNVSLHTDSSRGADGRLDLPQDTRFSRVFDARNVPGARYRLEVIDSAVPLWWVFFGGIESGRPDSEIVLGDCPFVIPSIIATNLRGTVKLPAPWPRHGETNAVFKVGNLTLRTEDKPVRTSTWGIYLSGGRTDVTFAGQTNCCEFMVWGGKVRFEGTPGTFDSVQACTTVDIHGDAEVRFKNATLSHRGPGAPILPQITVDGTAQLTAEDCELGKVRLFARDEGTMRFTNCTSRCEGSPLVGGGNDRITILAPPMIESVPCPRAAVGRPYSYTLKARPAMGSRATDIAVRVIGPLPAWLAFDAGGGVLSGTPAATDVGTQRVLLGASTGGLEREQSFTIAVADHVAGAGVPGTVPGLVLHLDAAWSGQCDEGATVSGWYDRSGKGHHARAASGLPRFRPNALEGMPAVHFSNGARMSCPGLREAAGGVTVFVVSQCLGAPSPDLWPRLVCAHAKGGVPWKPPGFQMMAPMHPSTHRGASHGVRIDTLMAADRTLANLNVASDGVTQQYYVGDVFEVLVYERRLTDAEMQAVKAYLRAKYPGAD